MRARKRGRTGTELSWTPAVAHRAERWSWRKARPAAGRMTDRFRRPLPVCQCLRSASSAFPLPRASGRTRGFPACGFPVGRRFRARMTLGPRRKAHHAEVAPSRWIENHARTPPFTLRLRLSRFRHRKLTPKAGNLCLRVFVTQAGTRFISSFQRWQATSCPSSVSSAGS